MHALKSPLPARVNGSPVEAPWSRAAGGVAAALDVDPAQGLPASRVAQLRAQWGQNRFREAPQRSALMILLAQFRSIVVLLLVAAGLLALVLGDPVEALAIAAVIAINTAIGFLTELRATRSMEALGRLATTAATVQRDGVAKRVAALELVPGDVVLLDAGDIIPADLRLVEAAKLRADESALTGESTPVHKGVDPVAPAAPVMERECMLYRGTWITRGSARAIVTATGMGTEIGRIFEQVQTAEPGRTPLERRLATLGSRLVIGVLVMAVALAIIGILVGREVTLAVEVAIALSVAAIPEGLPIVATIALARGMWRMARRNALITRLSSVETLGATSIIMTDKTGTLTENRMTVTRVVLPGLDLELDKEPAEDDRSVLLQRLLTRAVLCSNATLNFDAQGERHATGDPTEVALLSAAIDAGLSLEAIAARYPELREEPFDAEVKRMATLHPAEAGLLAAVKGAPEAILPLCANMKQAGEEESVQPMDDSIRRDWLSRAEALAAEGLRTLAIAEGRPADAKADPYVNLTLLGIVGMEDPPRAGVRDVIRQCADAGVRVVMVTGDHLATARSIAEDTGIIEPSAPPDVSVAGPELQQLLDSDERERLRSVQVFARVTPEEKLRLIALHQQAGQIVAMTGDGVNDAPALRKADIGVAMGKRGTAVAREAAAMVLQDDEFRTILTAIEQGRAIFANIRKFALYLLSCNISEVLVVVLATVAGAPLPLLPLQVLFLNLVTDVFPALALGVGEGSPRLMQQPPRPADEGVLTRAHWLLIACYGALISATVLGAMGTAMFHLGLDREQALSVSFLTLSLAQMWHVFNMREERGRWLRNEITANPWVWAALAICLVLVGLAVYLQPLAQVLRLAPPGPEGWLLVIVASLIPVALGPAVRRAVSRFA